MLFYSVYNLGTGVRKTFILLGIIFDFLGMISTQHTSSLK